MSTKLQEAEKTSIKGFLETNRGTAFDQLGIQDESCGRNLTTERVVNSLLIRHLKQHTAKSAATGAIGKFVYHECHDIIKAADFWTTKAGRPAFYYSWQKSSGGDDRQKKLSPETVKELNELFKNELAENDS